MRPKLKIPKGVEIDPESMITPKLQIGIALAIRAVFTPAMLRIAGTKINRHIHEITHICAEMYSNFDSVIARVDWALDQAITRHLNRHCDTGHITACPIDRLEVTSICFSFDKIHTDLINTLQRDGCDVSDYGEPGKMTPEMRQLFKERFDALLPEVKVQWGAKKIEELRQQGREDQIRRDQKADQDAKFNLARMEFMKWWFTSASLEDLERNWRHEHNLLQSFGMTRMYRETTGAGLAESVKAIQDRIGQFNWDSRKAQARNEAIMASRIHDVELAHEMANLENLAK